MSHCGQPKSELSPLIGVSVTRPFALLSFAIVLSAQVALAQDQKPRWEPAPKADKPEIAKPEGSQAEPGLSSPGARGVLAGEKAPKQAMPTQGKPVDPMILSQKEAGERYKVGHELSAAEPKARDSKEEEALRVVRAFYAALEARDYDALRATLSDELEFSDPAYPHLEGAKAHSMWKLITASDPLTIKAKIYGVEGSTVYGGWVADYELFGRPIHNVISSKITVVDGKIRFHRDSFDLERWSAQALPSIVNGGLNLLGPDWKAKALNLMTAFALHRFESSQKKR